MEQVVAAARAGDKKNAQVLLAQYIQANPNDAKGWYLMSQLVDSKARRAAYLSKTLALDPYHERAWAEFYSMPTEVINKLESAQGTHPPAAARVAPTPSTAPEPVAATVEAVAEPAAEEWETIIAEPDPEPAEVVLTETRGVPMEPTAAAKSDSKSGLTALLILLILATIAVLTYLLYLLLLG